MHLKDELILDMIISNIIWKYIAQFYGLVHGIRLPRRLEVNNDD